MIIVRNIEMPPDTDFGELKAILTAKFNLKL